MIAGRRRSRAGSAQPRPPRQRARRVASSGSRSSAATNSSAAAPGAPRARAVRAASWSAVATSWSMPGPRERKVARASLWVAGRLGEPGVPLPTTGPVGKGVRRRGEQRMGELDRARRRRERCPPSRRAGARRLRAVTEHQLEEGDARLRDCRRHEQRIARRGREARQSLGEELAQSAADRQLLAGPRVALHRAGQLERVERVAARRLVDPLERPAVELEARPGSQEPVAARRDSAARPRCA